MEKRIYEEIKRKVNESANYYYKALNIIEKDETIKTEHDKINLDFLKILSNLDLLEYNNENLEKLNEFHAYVTQLGIEAGLCNSRQLMIDSIKKGEIDFEELLDIDPNEFTDYDFKPEFNYNINR